MKGKFLIEVLLVVLAASFVSAGVTTNSEYTRDNSPNSYTSSTDGPKYNYDYWHWDFEKPKKSYAYAIPEKDNRKYDDYYYRHRDYEYRNRYYDRSYYSKDYRYRTSYTQCYDGRCYTSYGDYYPSDNFDTFYYWTKDKIDSRYNYPLTYYNRNGYRWDGISTY